MKYLSILITLFLGLTVSAQDIVLSGSVRSTSGVTIPFPSITDSGGVLLGIGNSLGHYRVTVPDSVAEIVFTCIGFEDNHLLLRNRKHQQQDIVLKEKVRLLPEVVVSPGPLKTEYLGPAEVKPDAKTISFRSGAYAALAVPFKVKEKPARVLQARIHIGEASTGNFAMRFRITRHSLSGEPGKDLLIGNALLFPKDRTGWVTVDLEPYNVWVDRKKFILLIELLEDPQAEHSAETESPGLSYQGIRGRMLFSTSPGVWRTRESTLVTEVKVGYID